MFHKKEETGAIRRKKPLDTRGLNYQYMYGCLHRANFLDMKSGCNFPKPAYSGY